MATTPEFKYAPMFQMGKDDTEYYLLSKEGVSVGEFEGNKILKVISVILSRRCSGHRKETGLEIPETCPTCHAYE